MKELSKIIFLIIVLFSHNLWSQPKYKTTSWGATDVIWVQDDAFPRFTMTIYFADGGLGDDASKSGTTQMMLDLLTSGTTQKNQSKIAEELDQLAVSLSAQSGYESSVISVSGLMREFKSSMDLVCHVLSDANFPAQEVNNAVVRLKSQLMNLSASPEAVAQRAVGIYTYAGTPYENPLNGRLVSLSSIKPEDLQQRWSFFKSQVKKRIYLLGPKSLLDQEKYISERCGFVTTGVTSRVAKVPENAIRPNAGKVIFVKIPNANQVQIRYSAPLSAENFKERFDLVTLASGILGSGFTSLLMQEVRVKKGYSYGVSSNATPRLLNGFSVIGTFTKNQTFIETVKVVENTLKNAQDSFSDKDHLESAKKFLTGKQLFQFDDSQKLLQTFINYDHLGRSYSEVFNFPKNIKTYKLEDVKSALKLFYPLEKNQYNWIFVGDESLASKVKENWKENVLILDYKDIL
jgi:zinc protease